MKKNVLITGANSYVGTNVENWLMKEPYKYHVETLDMKNPNWKDFDFSKFDVVFHVAGIAHVSNKKSMEDLYYKVNRDLTIETAQKAKNSGVKQFIFMSSMIVYNSKETRITLDTKPNPDNFYGQSKLDAEKGINELIDIGFNVTILRPPMIYGPSSKGNFSKLINFLKKTKVFPNFENKRSLLYIDTLCEIVRIAVDNKYYGILYPKNSTHLSILEIAKTYSDISNKKIKYTIFFNPLIRFLIPRLSIISKVFGDFYYEIEPQFSYREQSLRESLIEMKKEEGEYN